jgi:hypothetical protein
MRAFASVQDVAGDLLFLLESKKYTYKEWVDDLSVPYITFFVVAAGASIATVVGKIVLFVQKSRSRGRASARAVAPAIALADAAHEERLAKLDEDIEANRLDQRRAYVAILRMRTAYTGSLSRIALCRCCELLLLVCEDIPMGMQPPRL